MSLDGRLPRVAMIVTVILGLVTPLDAIAATRSLRVSDATKVEGQSGSSSMSFVIKLSSKARRRVIVDYRTVPGTATPGIDYVHRKGQVTFRPGRVKRTVRVPIIGDLVDEPNETLNLRLRNARRARIADATGRGIILDDDGRPTISIGSTSVLEGTVGDGTAIFPVTLSAASGKTVSAQWDTSGETAEDPADFTGGSGTVTIPAGHIAGQIAIAVVGDGEFESDETFRLSLANATNATLAPTGYEATGTILNDDSVDFAVVHYHRPDGDYGDHTTGSSSDFWGLHVWGDGVVPSAITDWTAPTPFLGEDEYGRFAWIRLTDPTQPLNFIVHRGDTKDPAGSPDRSFVPADSSQVWLRAGDLTVYTSQAGAQGFASVHYPCISCSGVTMDGDPPDSVDGYGAVFVIPLTDPLATQTVTIEVNGVPAIDSQTFIPSITPSAWFRSGQQVVYGSRAAAEGVAVIHYRRPAGDYGNPASSDFNDFWGLHVTAGAATPTAWQDPVRPTGIGSFGLRFEVELTPDAESLTYALHRGETRDPGADQTLNFSLNGHEVWQLQGTDADPPYVMRSPD